MHSPQRTPQDQINENHPLAINQVSNEGHQFHFWQGASGKRYIHTVYSLFNCPELPKTNYILVDRNQAGVCTPLSIGETTSDATSLNLAYLRQNAAKHRANEIHIHVLADHKNERNLVRLDLLAGQKTPE